MLTGTIKAIVQERGFGFIEPDDAGADLFFHVRSMRGMEWDSQLRGCRVEFDVGSDPQSGKPRAENVRPSRQ